MFSNATTATYHEELTWDAKAFIKIKDLLSTSISSSTSP